MAQPPPPLPPLLCAARGRLPPCPAVNACSARRPVAWVVLGLLVLAAGCREERSEVAPPPRPKVVLIGLDGATWTVIEPLLAAGELPHLQRLIQRGSRGRLRSVRPMKSPALWTTIATGRSREAHGIAGFYDEGRLVSALDRRTSAIWEWVSAFGREVGFTGWWASWPADRVQGWLVSDRAVRSRWSEWTDGPAARHATWPDALEETVRRVALAPDALTREEAASIVALDDAEWAELRAARKPIRRHWLSVFKFAFANQRSYENVALELVRSGQPDLLGILLIATDPISHTFWHFYEPGAFEGVDPGDAARLGAAIPNIYRHNDRFLGRLLGALADDTAVVIVSDHGFQASGVLPRELSKERFAQLAADADPQDVVAIGQSGKHHPDGILVLSGRGFRRGVALDAELVDVAPTVMALLGLPVAADLEGRVLREALDPRRVPQPVPVASYEPLVAPRSVDPADVDTADPELLERLRALGYVE